MEIIGGRVIKWASRSLEPDIFEDEIIVDPQALGNAVKQLMASSAIKGKNISISVSGLYSLSRIVTVPLGGAATQQVVLEAASEVMPLSEDEQYLSWQTVAVGEGGQQVLVIGVPRDMIDSEMQALRGSGVSPRVLDLKTMALIRAVNREQAIIFNIEPNSFDIVIVVGGSAEVMRTTAWQQSGLSEEEETEHLAVALELTIGFYNSHHPGFPLDPATPLFITGQMSGDIALVEKLQNRAGYHIEPLTPPLEYPAHLPVSQYAVNIGLALKGTASAKGPGQGDYSLPDINLLPEAYKPWKPTTRQIYILFAILAAFALLLPLYQVTSDAMAETGRLRTRYDAVNRMLDVRRVELSKLEPLQKAINQYDTIVDTGGGFVEDLEAVRSLAEELGVEVGSIVHNGGSIVFSCQADSNITFREYITALEESGRFSTPIIPPEVYPYIRGGSIALKPKPAE